jgi:wobble nucleotide-excising tRNase
MIKKFIKIAGTGKFLDYNHSTVATPHRTTDFEKLNLIYGENGSGKTTLSIILASLRGDNNLVLKKRSFNKAIHQTIEVLTDTPISPKYTFSSNAWNAHYPNLEIFDTHFINDNIYTGSEILQTHKRNLFEVIFGTPGIQLKQQIQDIKERIQNGNKSIREVKDKIELAIDKAYSAETFSLLELDSDIDSKISLKEVEINAAKNHQEILSKEPLTAFSPIPYPVSIESTIEILSTSINTISEQSISKFKSHKDHLKIQKSEQWLKDGYDAIANDTCPFCLRPFDGSEDIIQAYYQYFNAEYASLLKNIALSNEEIKSFNIDKIVTSQESIVVKNGSLIEFWTKYLSDLPEIPPINDIKENLNTELNEVVNTIKKKVSNPIEHCSSESIQNIKVKIDTLNLQITAINQGIASFNERVNALKNGDKPNLSQLEVDKKKLAAQKKLHDPTIKTLRSNYISYTAAIQALNAKKDEKQSELDSYSSTIFNNYTTKINYYLNAFAPYLEIRGLDSGYIGSSKEPSVKYALHIDGNEIKQEDSSTHPTFKYSLSEGDKSALALSFFLARLEEDGNLANKIIVFDDPVSSFDLNRKATTIAKLVYLGIQSKQLFVLTHNIIFAAEFWKNISQTNTSSQCSKIEFIGNSSCITEFIIDNETLISVLKDSLTLKNYLVNGAYTDQDRRSIARCIRPALESYFHLKFFDIVAPNEWLGNFIDKVRSSTSNEPFYRLIGQVQEMAELNDYSKKYHHRHNTNADSEQINNGESTNSTTRAADQ